MTLQELKEKYALKEGYDNFYQMLSGNTKVSDLEDFIDDLCILAQRKALENAHENINHVDFDEDDAYEVERFILSERNILK